MTTIAQKERYSSQEPLQAILLDESKEWLRENWSILKYEERCNLRALYIKKRWNEFLNCYNFIWVEKELLMNRDTGVEYKNCKKTSIIL